MDINISIIIPVYNCDNYLDTCITSVLMQSYSNFEIICINDNSSDNSANILKRYSQTDQRVKIFSNNENKGPGYCRNKGLNLAKGKYIFFLDADDWIGPQTLKILYSRCETNNLDLLMFKYIVFYNNKVDFGFEKYYDMNFMNKFNEKVFCHWDLNPNEVFNLPVGPCNKLYRKSFLEDNNIRFPEGNLIQEDNPFFFKVITQAERVSILNMYLYVRRRRNNSIMASLGDTMLFSRIYIAELLVDYFFSNPQLYDHYKKNLLNLISKHFLNESYMLINEEFKEEMYVSIQNLYLKFFKKYNLKDDVIKCTDNNLLVKFQLIED